MDKRNEETVLQKMHNLLVSTWKDSQHWISGNAQENDTDTPRSLSCENSNQMTVNN